MGIAIIALAGLTGVAAILIVGGRTGAYSGGYLSPIPSSPTSPLEEAESILARRYARGEINSDEYSRMLSILRR
jgi:hypothetical protein